MFLTAKICDGSNVFRMYCNKVTSKVLKRIGTELDFNKKLTCHVARHTLLLRQSY